MFAPKFRSGVFIAPFHALEEDPTLALRRDLKLVEWLDELGYEEAWFGEHHSGGFEISASPELMIAAAAERTRRIRLGSGVISLPYHNPLMVAERIVQLDHMTMGRVMFGVGPGLLMVDAKQMGIDPVDTRDMMFESLEIILRLFRGETVTAKTKWFELKDAALQLRPYSDPYPEVVVVSSNTPSGGRAAGRYGLNIICLAAAARDGFDALDTNWKIACEIAAENGHTMQRSGLRLAAPIHLAETREQAEANVGFGIEKFAEYNYAQSPALRERAKGLTPLEFVTKIRGGLVGTPDDAIALIERLAAKQGEFGCFMQIAHNWADWEQTRKSYELYARYVVPHFRQANPARAASLQKFRDSESQIKDAQKKSIAGMFDRYNAERAALGKPGVKPRP